MSASIDDLLSETAGEAFAAELSVGSNLAIVRRIIKASPVIGKLRELCRRKKDAVDRILESTRQIVFREVSPEYESPWDAALTAHLILLDEIDTEAALIAANLVMEAPRTWWARRQAAQMLTLGASIDHAKNTQIAITLPDEWRRLMQRVTDAHSYGGSGSVSLGMLTMRQHKTWPIRRGKIHLGNHDVSRAQGLRFRLDQCGTQLLGRFSDATATMNLPPCEIREH